MPPTPTTATPIEDRPVRLPSSLTVGTMNFGARTPAAEARSIIDLALERGAAFFDTANAYGDGASERILGEALEGRRDRAGIATKVGLLRRGSLEGLSAQRLPLALEESLARLRTDHVDLYYLHAPDPTTPIEETLDAMHALLDAGKVRAWGVSNFAAWQIVEINALCDARAMPRPAVSQVLYNLLVRQLDVEYFAFARRHPLHTTVYNPLAGGLLARDPEPGRSSPPGARFRSLALYRRRYLSGPLQGLAAGLAELARSEGIGLLALSYAWLTGHPGVNSVLAGPASRAHLEAALEARSVKLSAAARTQVDALHQKYLGTDAVYAR